MKRLPLFRCLRTFVLLLLLLSGVQYSNAQCPLPTANISYPSTVNVNNTVGECYRTFTINWSGANVYTYSIIMSGATTMNLLVSSSVTSYTRNINVGLTTVKIVANNTCGTDTATFNINVTDAQVPSVSGPTALTRSISSGCSISSNSLINNFSYYDNCGVVAKYVVPSTITIGTKYYTVYARDARGNTGSRTVSVTLRAPEVEVRGGNYVIPDGDVTPASPDYTHFGTVNFGSTSYRTYQVRNTGQSHLYVSGVSVQNLSSGGGFSLSSNPFPAYISPGQTVNFQVRFATSSSGPISRLATVTVHNGDCDESSYDFKVAANINCPIPTFTSPTGTINLNADAGKCYDYYGFSVTPTSSYITQYRYELSGATSRVVNTSSRNFAFNYNVGTTLVKVTAYNACGRSYQRSFYINVTDPYPPTISGPSSRIINIPSGCYISKSYYESNAGITATDNCAIDRLYSNAPSTIGPGTRYITWTAVDVNGRGRNITQKVEVRIAEITVRALNNTVINNNDFSPSTIDGTHFGVRAYNNPLTRTYRIYNDGNAPLRINYVTLNNGNGRFQILSAPSNTYLNPGSYYNFTVRYNANSGGTHLADLVINNGDCNEGVYKFRLVGTTQCPSLTTSSVSSRVVPTDAGKCVSAVQNWNFGYSSSIPVSLSYTFSGATTGSGSGSGSGHVFNKGVTTVRIIVSTGCETIQKAFTITVSDNEKPVIASPSLITVSTDNGSCTATGVNLTTPTVTDNCGVKSITNNAPSTYNIGNNAVIWTAEDVSGNTANVIQIVKVVDNQNPVITAPADKIYVLDESSCTMPLDSLGTPTATDNCTIVVNNNAPAAGLTKGTHTILWTAKDASGNTGVDSQIIQVRAPEIKVNGSGDYGNILAGSGQSSSRNKSFTMLNIGSAPLHVQGYNITGPDSAFFAVTAPNKLNLTLSITGGYSFYVSFSGTDLRSHNATLQIFNDDCDENPYVIPLSATVICNPVAITSCPANKTVSAASGQCSNNVNYSFSATGAPAPTSSYTFTGATTGSGNGTGSGSAFNVGVTNVRIIASNICSADTCNFTVTVNDNQNPIITVPADKTFVLDGSSCTVPMDDIGTATASDNCGIASISNNAPVAGFAKGTHAVLWTVTDVNGNTSVDSQIVQVKAPEIVAPGNANFGNMLYNTAVATTKNIKNIGDAPLHIDSVTLTGPDSNKFSVGNFLNNLTVQPGLTQTFAIGFTATKLGLNQATLTIYSNDCDESPHVVNLQANVLCNDASFVSCPTNITANADNGKCNALVNYTANATGGPSPTYSYNFTGATTGSGNGTGSGSSFNTGVTNVQIIASNGCSADTCSFTITVNDNQNPTINAPAAVTVNADNGGCAAGNISLGTPTTADNCGIDSVWNNAPSSFPVGMTIVKWTVEDVHGNTASTYQIVTVNDNQAPVIACPSNITVNTDNGTCGAVVGYNAPTVTDNCSVGCNTPSSIQGYTLIGTFGGHTYFLSDTAQTWYKNNADAIALGAHLATINTEAENEFLYQNTSVLSWIGFNDSAVEGTFVWTNGEPVTYTNWWTDEPNNGGGVEDYAIFRYPFARYWNDGDPNSKFPGIIEFDCAGTYVNKVVGLDSGANFPVGTTTVTHVVTDGGGNTDSCSFTVTVIDNEKPTITAPPAVTVNADNGSCGAIGVALGTPTTGDNCGVANTSNNAPTSFPVGTTTVTWTVTDVNGNTNTATQDVIVIDNQNPTITAPAAVTVNADNGQCSATNVVLGTPATGDNCGVANTSNNAPTSFPVGTTTVTWTVTDVNGNTNTATQDVIVIDNQNPTITSPAAVTVNADNGQCSATNVVLGTPATGDNCGVANTSNNAPTSFPVGTTTVTWTVTDVNGNTNTATQDVIVIDNQNPTITTPAAVTVNADNGSCAATSVALGTPTTADNCGVDSVWNNALSSYPVGTTTVTWTVTDVNGNTNTATQDVIVIDNQNPTITAPSAVTINADNGQCSATNVALGTPATADNCGVATTVNDAPASFAVGTTTVTWTVTDIHGNISTATQDVVVVDNQAPIVVCKNYTVTLTNGTATISPSDVDNGSTDNCGIASRTLSDSTFTCADAGDNTVVLTVTDIHGNSASCTATVIVPPAPSVTIATTPSDTTYTGGNPNNIYLGYGSQSATITATGTGGTSFTYTWSPSTGLSNANVQSPVFTPTAAGNYTYTVTATNEGGCTATSTVSFCVLDVQQYKNQGGTSGKIYVCITKNNGSLQTKAVQPFQVAGHLQNGHRLGKCDENCGSGAKGNNIVNEESEEENTLTTMRDGKLKIYPNPTTGTFTIDVPDYVKGGTVIIRDIAGKQIRRTNFNPNAQLRFTLEGVADGVYIVEVHNNNDVYRERLIIRR